MQRWLTVIDVCERYHITRSTVYRYVKDGTLPPPIKLSAHSVRWNIEQLDQHDKQLNETTL